MKDKAPACFNIYKIGQISKFVPNFLIYATWRLRTMQEVLGNTFGYSCEYLTI